ncbi:Protein MAIN-LIKE 1 [Glycine soja]
MEIDTGARGVISAFVERWHKETSSFHLPIGELTITLDDVASLLHLPIIGAFHSFEPLHVDEAVLMLVELLEVSGEEARAETTQCHGAYIRLSWLRDFYQRRCEAPHWTVAARARFPRLQSEWKLCIGSCRPSAYCWIYEHFPNIHERVNDPEYDEMSPRACWWLTTKAYSKGFPASTYRTCINALTIPDVCWMPYGEHRGVRAFDLISCFQGASLSFEDIDDRWMHYSDHLAVGGQICLVPGQYTPDYMDWFFRISHPFITPTQAADPPIHPPVLQYDTYVKPDIPEVPVAPKTGPSHAPSDVEQLKHAVDVCQVIAKRLERLLNLRIVTAGTKIHEVMKNCIKITRGVTVVIDDVYNCLVFDNIFVFPNIFVSKSQELGTRMGTRVEV